MHEIEDDASRYSLSELRQFLWSMGMYESVKMGNVTIRRNKDAWVVNGSAGDVDASALRLQRIGK